MAIIPETQYPGKIDPASANYPYGEARNITLPGDGTGTPLEAAWVKDLFGFLQGMLVSAAITPSGSPDTAVASQYRNALEFLSGRVFTTIAGIEAYTPVAASQQAFLTHATRGGTFRWDSSDLSTEVAADTLQGIYIAPTSDPTGASGAWVRQFSGPVNALWFGADPTGVTNNTPIFQAIANLYYTHIFVPGGTFLFGGTVQTYVGTYIFGESSGTSAWATNTPTKFVPDSLSTSFYEADGSQTANGYLFFMNVDPASPATWVQQFPNIGAGGIHDVTIDGTNTGNIKLAYFAGSYEFSDIRHIKVSTLLRCVDTLYQDHINIKRLFGSSRANQTDYLVYLNALGDSVEVGDISSGYTGSQTGITKGVYFGNLRGGRLYNLINGSHTVIGAHATVIEGLHQEGGNLTIDDAEVSIRSSIFFLDEDQNIPIVIQSTNGPAGERYQVTIDDIEFAKVVNHLGFWPTTTDVPDIQVTSNASNVIIGKGNHRTVAVNGSLDKKQSMGIIVENSAASVTDWEQYSHMLTKDGTLVTGGYTELSGNVQDNAFAFTGWASASIGLEAISGVGFNAASATYYYGILLLCDPVRLIGRTAATTVETSGAVTNGGSLPRLTVTVGSVPRDGGFILRVYRGTSTGSYDKYVDLPAITVREMYDDGNALNGFPWKSRGAAGIDTINTNAMATPITLRSGRADCGTTDAAIPTAGTWKKGDRVRQMAPVIDGNNMVTDSYLRLTDGSNHVNNTDWAVGLMSTVSPAV